MTKHGHNSGIAADELKQFIERIERLQEERKAIADDVRDIYAEARGRGFDVPTIKKIVQLRAKEPHEREEQEALLDLYMGALGMIPRDEPVTVSVSHAPARAPAPAPAPAPAREEPPAAPPPTGDFLLFGDD